MSRNAQQHQEGEKVGSSESAAEHFGGRGDFGIPASKAQPGQQTVIDGSLEDRPLGTRPPPLDPEARRDVGVGAPDSGPGRFRGGDLDPDITGVGSHGRGLAASPDRRTTGPDITQTATDANAVGGPDRGENEMPRGTHGTTGRIKGTVHDRMDRQVRLGQPALDDSVAAEADRSSGEVDRSTGGDVDDREAATGKD
jgi:hypothetical protein